MEMNGEERVLATAQHIVNSLGSSRNDIDMIEIFSKYDDRFQSLKSSAPKSSTAAQSSQDIPDELSSTLRTAEEVILRWDKGYNDQAWETMVWDTQQDALDYLHAVDEVINILDSLSLAPQAQAGVEKAQSLLLHSMVRLEDEFRFVLQSNSKPVDPEDLVESIASSSRQQAQPSLGSARDEEGSTSSYGHADVEENSDDDEDIPVAQPVTDVSPVMQLLPLEVVDSLHDIAKRLVLGDRKQQCCQIYGSVRKKVVEECLHGLGMDRLSIEEVHRMPWDTLQGKIKKWTQVLDVGVKVVLASERQLCDQVFEEVDLGMEDICFAEFAKPIMMQLLTFGEAIAISRRETDKLISMLDMYEKLRDVLPEIQSIFTGEVCLNVREQASGVLLRLGEAARGTFGEFENAIKRDPPKNPVPRGALHPLTRYVMNYLQLLLVYVDTLRQLFGEKPEAQVAGGYGEQDDITSPLAVQFIWIIHIVQQNLESKSKLYKDLPLSHLFLMNNVHYIVKKVKSSEMRWLLGDDWLRKHTNQVRQHGKNYERSAWAKVLSFLKDEGIRTGSSFSSGVSKATLKERFKSFNCAVEEIQRTQSLWCVPDTRLRSEVILSIEEKVVQAYRAFLGRYKIYLEGERNSQKYIKYTPEEVQNMLDKLFGGT